MSKDTQRQRNLTVTDKLTIGPNAVVRRRLTGNKGYDILFPLSSTHQVITTTKTVSAAENGTHFILNTATAFVSTLPAVEVGLEYWFHVGATEPTTSHTIVTASSANIINGNICSPEDAAGSVSVAVDSDTISFIASKALHGDFAHVWCDGTNWYLDGMCTVQDGMTATQAT